jgi:hypothetical protein
MRKVFIITFASLSLFGLLGTNSFADTLLNCQFDTQINGVALDAVQAQIMSTSAPGSYVTVISFRDSTAEPELVSPPMTEMAAQNLVQTMIPIEIVAGDQSRYPLIFQTLVSIVKTPGGLYGLQTIVQIWQNETWVTDSTAVNTDVMHCQVPTN